MRESLADNFGVSEQAFSAARFRIASDQLRRGRQPTAHRYSWLPLSDLAIHFPIDLRELAIRQGHETEFWAKIGDFSLKACRQAQFYCAAD
jgi:hypothetical protein